MTCRMSSGEPPVPPPSPPSLPSLSSAQRTPPNEIVNPDLAPLPVQVPVAPSKDSAASAPMATASSDNPYECNDTDTTEALPRHGFFGWCRETEDERFEHVLATTGLTRMQKNSIRRRFFEILREFRFRCRAYSLLFHVGHFTITVGSLVVPALLSVQYAGAGITFVDANSFQAQVYWTTWILSLLVTMFNGVLVLFKVDMKYYFLHTTLERLRSEGWQYLQLTGRYAGALASPNETPTHRNQFKYFCHYIEKIKLKQVEEEYYKYEDSQKNAGATPAAAAGATSAATPAHQAVGPGTAGLPSNFYPPSLQANLASLAEQAPPSVQDAIRSLVRTQPQAQPLPANPQTIASPNRVTYAMPMQPTLRQSTP
jgi:hypothetical protein